MTPRAVAAANVVRSGLAAAHELMSCARARGPVAEVAGKMARRRVAGRSRLIFRGERSSYSSSHRVHTGGASVRKEFYTGKNSKCLSQCKKNVVWSSYEHFFFTCGNGLLEHHVGFLHRPSSQRAAKEEFYNKTPSHNTGHGPRLVQGTGYEVWVLTKDAPSLTSSTIMMTT